MIIKSSSIGHHYEPSIFFNTGNDLPPSRPGSSMSADSEGAVAVPILGSTQSEGLATDSLERWSAALFRSDSATAARASSVRSSVASPSRGSEMYPLSTVPANDAAVIPIPNIEELAAELRTVFAPHINRVNHEEFEALILDRAVKLDAKHETLEGLRAVLTKGMQFDRAARGAAGFVRSVPFGVASRMFDTVPALTSFVKTPAEVGMVVGTGSGVADTACGTLLRRATLDDTQWLEVKPEELEPAMAQAYEAVRPSLKRTAVEEGVAFQSFSARNAARAVVAPLVTKTLGVCQAASVDSWFTAIGGPVSGAAAHLAIHQMNASAHRVGPEYLLGRTDWETHYDALKQATWRTQIQGAAKRAAKLPVDVATDSLAAVRSVFTATNLGKNVGALGGGFAGVLAAKASAAQVARRAHAGEVTLSAIEQTVNAVVSAPAFAAWTAVDVLGPSTIDQAVDRLQGGWLTQSSMIEK